MYSFPFLEASTEESPQTMSNSNSKPNTQSKTSFPFKKSISSFPPSEPFLHSNAPSDKLIKRKLTLEPSSNIKDFVPRLKPLQIHFVPSKLRLNCKDYTLTQQHISCPNTNESESISSEDEDEDEDGQYVHLKATNQMKNLRKIMKRSKHNNVIKVFSKEVICNKRFDNDNDNEGSYLDEDDLYSDNENEYYNEEKYVIEGLSKGNDINHNSNNKRKEGNKIKRVKSCSILQILESNLNMNII